MKNVFISYAREDTAAARMLAEALGKAGLPVWWDRRIAPGKSWDEEIGRALDAAGCVVVLWSKRSVESRWVREEAERARTRGCLVPVLIEEVPPPFGFGLIQAADLAGWRGDERDPRFKELLAGVAELTGATLSGDAGSLPFDVSMVDRPVNLGFDGPVEKGFPHGWFNSLGHVSGVSTDYAVEVLRRDGAAPGRCLKLAKHGARPEEFGSVMQRFPGAFLAGHTVRLEGEMRTEGVAAWAGLWLRADGENAPDLFFDNTEGRGLTGTTAWAHHAVEGRLPPETAWVNLGIVLCGAGAVYADNLRLLRWTGAGEWTEV